MSRELVSVILPTYNRSWGLRLAMRSVLAQEHEDFELLVVDDASPDDTPRVVAEVTDSRLRYVRQPTNVGMTRNWGHGVSLARGEYLVFLADDDQLGPGFLSRRVAALRGHPSRVVAFSDYEVRDREGALLRVHHTGLPEGVLDSPGLLRAALSNAWFVGAALYRRAPVAACWPRIQGDDLVLDLGLHLRLALEKWGEGVNLAARDFIMTEHPGQNSQARLQTVYAQASALLERTLGANLPRESAGLLRQKLASWELSWGRELAREGRVSEARPHFLKAVRTWPRMRSAWNHALASWLLPRLVVASARR